MKKAKYMKSNSKKNIRGYMVKNANLTTNANINVMQVYMQFFLISVSHLLFIFFFFSFVYFRSANLVSLGLKNLGFSQHINVNSSLSTRIVLSDFGSTSPLI